MSCSAFSVRVDKEPAYMLHSRAYRESSSLLEVFTPGYGRVGLVHKGGRRLAKRGSVMWAFCELSLSWTGRGELFTLTKSDVLTANGIRIPDRMICGLYLNELILHMIPRLLPSLELYRCYAKTVSMLNDTDDVALLLRKFEINLLHSTGYGLQLEYDAEHGTAIDPGAHYYYDCTRGPIRYSSPSIAEDARDRVSGRTLIWLRTLDGADKSVMREAKRLLRRVLDYHLQDKPVHTRSIMRYIHRP